MAEGCQDVLTLCFFLCQTMFARALRLQHSQEGRVRSLPSALLSQPALPCARLPRSREMKHFTSLLLSLTSCVCIRTVLTGHGNLLHRSPAAFQARENLCRDPSLWCVAHLSYDPPPETHAGFVQDEGGVRSSTHPSYLARKP
jgi:hypothetical protein